MSLRNLAYLLPAFLAAASAAASSAETRSKASLIPEIRIPLMQKIPILDGEVRDSEWADADRMQGMARRRKSDPALLALQDVAFWVGTDGKNLWMAMRSQTPPGGKLLARVQPTPDGSNAKTWLDDSIEIYLDPRPDSGDAKRRVYQANINAKGASWSQAGIVSGGGEVWGSSFQTKSRVVGDVWNFEAMLPLDSIGLTAEDLKSGIGLRIARNWKQQLNTDPQTEWGAIPTAFNDTSTMPRVILNPAAPIVQVRQVVNREKRNAEVLVSLRNPNQSPQDLALSFSAKPDRSAPVRIDERVTLAPAEERQIRLGLPGGSDPGEVVRMFLNVASPVGDSWYRRAFDIQCDKLDELWETDTGTNGKVDLQFAYYPSYHQIRAVVDFSNLPNSEKVSSIKLQVLNKGGKEIAATETSEFKDGRVELFWDIPADLDGEYVFRATLNGVVGLAPLERAFERRRFPWEGSSLGLSGSVVPPFLPIRYEDSAVSVLLRNHKIGEAGLWSQIIAEKVPLLASPIKLIVRQGERASEVAGTSPLKIEKSGTDHLVLAGSIKIGTLEAQISEEWDVDGQMLWHLDLPANPSSPIQSLRLMIPIKAEEATLMHACTDGIRFNYAGNIPQGSGVVWKSSQAARNWIAGDYVPYLWVGTERRGISVYGENDRGWITGKDTPCQEVVREDGKIIVYLNLISGPATWLQPRRITVGFQATPTKSMPEGWRTTFVGPVPADVMKDYGDRIRRIEFLGSTGTYGSLVQATEPRPRDDDFSIWDYLKKVRRTGERDEAFLSKWNQGYPPISPDVRYLSNAGEINFGSNTLSAKPTEVLAYTNARGVRLDSQETKTFLDEWLVREFENRRAKKYDYVLYDVDPGRSYQDWMLSFYSKMERTFCDHLYWDDVFLSSNFDLIGTEAYRREDGRIQPASGLQNMRNLIRRTAVMEHDEGRQPFNMAHMTNTAIAPILSYAQMIYTWEDKAGDLDFQDRFSSDYVRAESLGLAHGTVPVALNLIHTKDKEKAAWVGRTMAGVLITHEVRPQRGPEQYWEAFRKLLEFGYGTDGVRVWNYWDPDYPVSIDGSSTSSILLTRPGSALLVLCDYGKGGKFRVSLDTACLALGKRIAITNVMTGDVLTEENGSFVCSLRKHDYAVFRIDDLTIESKNHK